MRQRANISIVWAMPKLATIHERIRYARVDLRKQRGLPKLTFREIAAPFGIAITSAREWEVGPGQPTPDKIPALAKLLNVNIMWLAYGLGLPEHTSNDSLRAKLEPGGGRTVPALSPSDAAKDFEQAIVEATTRSPAHFDCGPRAFSIELWSNANAPDFPIKARVVIDPDVKAQPGDMVFAVVGDGEPAFGQLAQTRQGGVMVMVLRPRNPAFAEEIISDDGGRIIGTMTEHAIPRQISAT